MNKTLAVGSSVAALLVAGTGVAVAAPHFMAPVEHSFTITFPTASGLVAGSDVLEAGAKVGTITEITPLTNNRASVTVQVQDDHWPLHQGLTADIRPKSLLGEKYVDLHDGPAKNKPYDPNQVLQAPDGSVPVELDQFVNSLDSDTRSALKVLLDDLGAGVAGRGLDLNQAIQSGRDDLAHLAVTGQTLNNRDPDLDRILVGLDGLFQKITQDDQLTQMSQLIDNGKATLDAIEAEQQSFTRSFVDAETALAEANTSFDTVVASLRGTIDVAPALLANVTQESNLLAYAGKATLGGTSVDGQYSCGAPGCQVQMLAKSILGGPYTTGGAQEWRFDDQGNFVDALPIFRVCLATPDSTGSSLTVHSCTGHPTAAPASTASFTGGASDAAVLAGMLGI